MQYRREMTGWCQLLLPSPPDAPLATTGSGAKSLSELSIEDHVWDMIDKADHLYQQVAGSEAAAVSSGGINMNSLDGDRHYNVQLETSGMLLAFSITWLTIRAETSSLENVDANSESSLTRL